MLRASRVIQANRVASSARRLSSSLLKLRRYLTEKATPSRIQSLGKGIHIHANRLAHALYTKRHFVQPLETAAAKYRYDPRFLAFEYIFDIVLRQRQVEIVNSFRQEAITGSGQIVQQMIMGAGKTTVVSPLLSLCLADGDRLVTQVMPTNLLEQSRNVLRRAFSSPVMPKRIYTFAFSRGVEDDSNVVRQVSWCAVGLGRPCLSVTMLVCDPACV